MVPPSKALIKDFYYQPGGVLPRDCNRALSLSLPSHICLSQGNNDKRHVYQT